MPMSQGSESGPLLPLAEQMLVRTEGSRFYTILSMSVTAPPPSLPGKKHLKTQGSKDDIFTQIISNLLTLRVKLIV